MRVIHLISGLRGGGAEHLVLDLCKQSLNDPQIDMKVLILSSIDGIAYKFHEAGIHPLSGERMVNKRKTGSAITVYKSLLTLIRQDKNTIIHAHMFHACIFASFVKIIRPSIKIIFTLHNNYVPEWHRRLLLFLAKPLRNTDIIFTGSRAEWYQKKNAVNIPNGINVSKFIHLKSEKPPVFTFVFVGRIEEQKNPLFLVELAKSLRQEYQFIIRVAGEGSLMQDLKKLIDQFNLHHLFELSGFHNDIPQLLAQSHCLLLPSAWEGMPLVILEAGAAGVPVLATPVGNLPYILNNSNAYIGELNEFPILMEEVMNNYGEALIKARRLKDIVINKFAIHDIYHLHAASYRALSHV